MTDQNDHENGASNRRQYQTACGIGTQETAIPFKIALREGFNRHQRNNKKKRNDRPKIATQIERNYNKKKRTLTQYPKEIATEDRLKYMSLHPTGEDWEDVLFNPF